MRNANFRFRVCFSYRNITAPILGDRRRRPHGPSATKHEYSTARAPLNLQVLTASLTRAVRLSLASNSKHREHALYDVIARSLSRHHHAPLSCITKQTKANDALLCRRLLHWMAA